MRRWLLILLLAILPVQFGWASVAQYDGHEMKPVEAGLHSSGPEAADQAPADGCVPGDAHCHALAMGPAWVLMDLSVLREGTVYPPRTEQLAWGRAAPDIDRPKWPRSR